MSSITLGGASGSATHGFLFADLRGYTVFVERAGAHRAVVMLERYRELVREQVGRFQGAEIRTEGDSFYVVFDRASAAIECGLAIVAAAVDASVADPQLPIGVGVGVHAGETVATADGYVGTAVNIAARVCAVAPANQVLVTDTVRALTAGVAPVQFASVGTRRLKGLAQPIALYRALPAGSAAPVRRLVPAGHLPLVAFALAGIVLAGAVGAGLIAAGLLGRPAAPGIGETGSTDGSASPTGAASASAGPNASSEPSLGSFPTGGEDALLGLLRPRPTDECQRMLGEDAPRHFYPDADGVTRPHAIDYVAGVDCALGGISGPDRAWLWELPPPSGGSSSRVPSPNEVVSLQGSRVGAAPGGNCATQVPALEQWSFGPHASLLLCYLSETGDAVVMWTYDDETLIGKAIRDDLDMAALLAWWSDVARFGPS